MIEVFKIRKVFRAIWSSMEPDIRKAEKKFLESLDEEGRELLLEWAAHQFARDEIRRMRICDRRREQKEGGSFYVPALEEWKRESDLTVDDCLSISESYRLRANQNREMERKFETWALEMIQGDYEFLGDLPSWSSAHSERIKSGQNSARESGSHIGGTPVKGEALERILELDSEGKGTTAIANALNEEGYPTTRGGRNGTPGKWHPGTVKNVLKRVKEKSQ